MDIIRCNDVSFGYENHTAVDRVSFLLKQGDFLCIVGKNGSGKSTLLKGILGFLKPMGGELEFSKEVKEHGIGYLPQQTAAQKNFPATVMEVVLSGCLKQRGYRPFYSKKEKEIALYNLERIGMVSRKNRCYCDLSGGQQQRVLIARALCATKDILLLDEPTTGLDPKATMELYHVLEHLNKEEHVTIIMVSHDVQNSISHATHILHMRRQMKFFGTVQEYKQSEIGKEFLGGMSE
ncbi:MAG: metal ABC transporter ATP-binding protein [Candidatus Fimimorpha sp.]